MVSVAKSQTLVHIGAPPRCAPGHEVSTVSVGFVSQGFHQPKASDMSHEVSLLPPCSSGHFIVVHTTKLLHMGEEISSFPIHQYNITPHEEWRVATCKATTPSPKGHNDLKHSSSRWYKGTTTQYLNVLRLLGINLTWTNYGAYLNLGCGSTECKPFSIS